MADTYFGLYRGKVLGARDPMNLGRLQVMVPSVHSATWAAPCQPYGSASTPPAGSTVWVMFEEGDINYPVWMGCGTDL